MIGVADQQRALQFIGFEYDGNAPGGLFGVASLGFGDQVYVWNAEFREIVAADLTFAEFRVAARAPKVVELVDGQIQA